VNSGNTTPTDHEDDVQQVSASDVQVGAIDSKFAEPKHGFRADGSGDSRSEHDGLNQAGVIYDPPEASQAENRASTDNDPFSIRNLAVSQGFREGFKVENHNTFIYVGRSKDEWWFRVHPGESFQLKTLVLEYERELYLIAPGIQGHLRSEKCARIRQIVTCINRQGTVFLWALKDPRPNGRINAWSHSAYQASLAAKDDWVRVVSDVKKQQYVMKFANGKFSEPEWPNVSFQQLLDTGFKDRKIGDLEHEVLKQLRGEV